MTRDQHGSHSPSSWPGLYLPLLLFALTTLAIVGVSQRLGQLMAEDAAVSDSLLVIHESLTRLGLELNRDLIASGSSVLAREKMARLTSLSDQVDKLARELGGLPEMAKPIEQMRSGLGELQTHVLAVFRHRDKPALLSEMAVSIEEHFGTAVEMASSLSRRYGEIRLDRIRKHAMVYRFALAVWGLLAVCVGFWLVRREGRLSQERASAVIDIRREQRKVRELSILSEMMGYINEEIEQERMLESMMIRAQELLRARSGFIVLLHPETRVVQQYVASSPIKDRPVEIWLQSKLFDEVLTGQAPLRILDTDAGNLALCPTGTDNLLAVPLIHGNQVHGLLVLLNKRESQFNQDDEDTLLNFAFHAYQAIHLHSEITRKASTDGLTGLCNHRVFQERLTAEIARHSRYSRSSVSLVMFDIDHFKSFNDNYGHQTGDKVLRHMADVMTHMIRSIVDIPARYGGEEFVLILPETGPTDALLVADRIRMKIEREGYLLESGDRVSLTVSAGIASCPEDATGKESLIRCADKALYAAKKGGRNRCCRFDVTMK